MTLCTDGGQFFTGHWNMLLWRTQIKQGISDLTISLGHNLLNSMPCDMFNIQYAVRSIELPQVNTIRLADGESKLFATGQQTISAA